MVVLFTGRAEPFSFGPVRMNEIGGIEKVGGVGVVKNGAK
jgi:hypothetical protein